MTTNFPGRRPHGASDQGKLLGRQTKRVQLRFDRGWFGGCGGGGTFSLARGRLFRDAVPHTGRGPERTGITKILGTFFLLSVVSLLSVMFSARPALGHDAPIIVPAQLDFDASPAPKDCNDEMIFRTILETWLPKANLREDPDRHLVVRLLRSSSGGIRTDVVLADAQGTTVSEWHDDFAAKTDCHKVLWTAALHSAELLGAFDPPPPPPPPPAKEPVICPACPVCVACPSPLPVPRQSISTPASSIRTMPATPPHSYVGLGGFVGTGIYSGLSAGPYLLLGFGISDSWPNLRVEFEGSWTKQEMPGEMVQAQSIPLVGSLCLVRGIVRFCGGLATTVFSLNQSSRNNELQFQFAPNFRVGTEWYARGAFSLRGDVFMRFAIAERTIGNGEVVRHDAGPVVGGLAILGVWTAK